MKANGLYPIENKGTVSDAFLDYWNNLMYEGARITGMNYIEFNLLVECVIKPLIVVVLLFVIYLNYRKLKNGFYFRKAE